MAQIATRVSGNNLVFSFDYDPKLVATIKSTLSGVRFDGSSKTWSAPITAKNISAAKSFGAPSSVIEQATAIFEQLKKIPPEKPVIRISASGNKEKLIAKFNYSEDLVAAVKAIPGAIYSKDSRCWVIPLSEASVQAFHASPELFVVEQDAQALVARYAKEVAASFAADVEKDFEIEGLKGTLKPFQKAGVAYLARRKRTFLADDMGMGKTIQVLATLQYTQAFPAIIVTPASLKKNWEKEANKWLNKKVVILSKNSPQEALSADIVITNYEQMKLLPPMKKKAIVFDESHYLKSHDSKRTLLAQKLAEGTEYRFLLSGTPLVNRPIELVSQLSILGLLDSFGGFKTFTKRFCGAKQLRYGWDFSGATNTDQLKTELRGKGMIRRLKSEVLTELPDLQRTDIEVEIDNRAEYRRVQNDLISFVKERAKSSKARYAELKKAGLKDEEIRARLAEEADAKADAAYRAETLVRINTLRQVCAKGKISSILGWISDFLEGDKKLVIFGIHKEVLSAIQGALREQNIRFVSLTGEDSMESRNKAVESFQNDESCRVFVASMQAGGTGLTLTAASDVLFAQYDWTEASHAQAEARCHRIGQKNAVNSYFFKADCDIDDFMAEMIAHKREIANLDDREASEKGGVSAFLKKITKGADDTGTEEAHSATPANVGDAA